MCHHGLLVFPAQELGGADLTNFMSKFTTLRPRHGVEITLEGFPHVVIVSNIEENGEAIGHQPDQGIEWHSDGTGWQQDTLATCLYGVEIPKQGGDTLFANGYLSLNALPPALSKQVKSLSITYSRLYLYERLGYAKKLSTEELAQFSDVTKPLVVTHPVTQREALVFSIEECKCIDGMNESQSYEFLSQLLEFITAENQIYRHQWSVGDLLVWDNRCMMHTPTEYNYATQRRRLHRVIGLEPG
ncbi:MAG TPA: TauD/TfdA family dioxygenase [Gammaproteobacteria bacterium]|nr:TauD/TfdA family dioxygenase [Gammaproteobacteria bacterium]